MTPHHKPRTKALPRLSPPVESAAEAEDMLLWAMEHVHKIDNRDFSFAGLEYMVDLYQDEAPEIVVKKAVQRGVSTFAELTVLHDAIKRRRNSIYYLPTDGDMRDFVQSRFNPILDQNPDLAAAATDVDNVHVKNFGNCMIHFRGMKSASRMAMVPADTVVKDETDLVDGEVKMELADERTAASPHPRSIALSKPSFPGFMIDRMYEETDKKERCFKCGHCGKWNEPSQARWPDHFEAGYWMCKCNRKIDVRTKDQMWVPQRQAVRHKSGYWIPAFISPAFDVKKHLEKFRKVINLKNFYNAILGLAYADRDVKMDEAAIYALCGDYETLGQNVADATAGVDVGKALHVTISREGVGGLRQYIFIGELTGEGKKPWEDLHTLFYRMNVKKYVIDRYPETDSAEEFLHEHRDAQGWLCEYSGDPIPSWNEEKRVVKVDRTASLDHSQAVLRHRKCVIPRRCRDVEEFARHCSNIARDEKYDEKKGEKWYEWVQGGPDHYRHAFNLDVLAWTPRNQLEEEGDTDFEFFDVL